MTKTPHDTLCDQLINTMHNHQVNTFSWWGTMNDGTLYQLTGRRVETGELATGEAHTHT